MKLITAIKQKLEAFRDGQSGSFAILSVLMMFVICLIAGAAIDYSRLVHTRAKMYNALDAAILASGSDLSRGLPVDAQFQQNFENFFQANINGLDGFGEDYEVVDFFADANTGEVSAKVASTVDATLTQLLGIDELDVVVESAAIFSSTDLEITMMLDVTGSMEGQKIADLRAAAEDAVNILLPNNNTRGTRIGLVPYSWSVNAGREFAGRVTRGNVEVASANGILSTLNTHLNTNRCVTERGGSNAATDASYRDARLGSDERAVRNNLCPRLKIRPLTNNRSNLINDIRSMRAEGFTAGHLGIAWSYYMLSENWQDLWPQEADPAPYSDDVRKIAILMTDGEFNTFFNGTTGNAFGPYADESNGLALELCENMKSLKDGNPGITIYSIAFDAPVSARATLQACANEDTDEETFYYEAESGEELRQAFREIAGNLQSLRISR